MKFKKDKRIDGLWEAERIVDKLWISSNEYVIEKEPVTGKYYLYVNGQKYSEAKTLKAYRLVDNKLNESEWDDVLLAQELEELDKEQMKLFGFDFGEYVEEEEKKYTMKTNIPQYEIKGETPSISELVDTGKVKELLHKIKQSNVSEEEKKFLRYGAYRHLCFNYSKIAEYYANADKEMQELMEDSALVIIDFEDAIAKGYVEMSEQVALLRGDNDEA